MDANPFVIIPWDKDFFTVLREHILERTNERPEDALVVFPHDRPRRYVQDSFAALGRATFLPRTLTVREVFAALRPADRPLREAGLIDRVALLYACCQEVGKEDDPLGRRLIRGGESAFFPWGEHLDALLEECLNQNITPVDLHHAETEVAPFGADLLAALGRIFARYVAVLPEQGRTTPGLDAHLAVNDLDGDLPPLFADKAVFLAGFHILTGSEERLFKRLWEQGARIMLHSDPALADPQATPHWSCEGHARWLRKWRAGAELACPSSDSRPTLHFFSGHDLHSQLHQLSEDLTADLRADNGEERRSPSRAVALPHPDLLLPVLHHLPEKRCNISLGYPMERTALCRLLECILQLAENSTPEGLIPWREFSELACHPWLRMLTPKTADAMQDSGPDFTALLHVLDHHIRDAARFQDPDTAVAKALEQHRLTRDKSGCVPGSERSQALLLERVLEHTVYSWRRAATLADMANCLAGLTELLATAGQDVWQRFPLDGEGLMRLAQRIIPPLRDNLLANVALPITLRNEMLRSLIRAERVPFEADPITGLQVLGMLETRLLHVSRVYVVDATDATLPGAPGHDPLLPDSLRAVLGLPDIQQRDLLAAHTFHRLLAGADEVFLYWQEGAQASGLLDSVSQRSRLVEELIWKEEQSRRVLLKPGDPPLAASSIRLRPPRRELAPLQRSEAMHRRMASLLDSALSATALDEYLRCPLQFYYSRLIGLSGRQEVIEGDEPMAVGELLHTVLQELYEPFKGKLLRQDDIDEQVMHDLFARHLAQSPLRSSLPPESLIMFGLSGPVRLSRYLCAQPERTRILDLERDVSVPVAVCGEQAVLRGRMDRVDERQGERWILDYKTGRSKGLGDGLWKNETLWQSIASWLHDAQQSSALDEDLDARGNSLLQELSVACPSVQLPCYIAMSLAENPETREINAAYVNLATDGEEAPLFGPKTEPANRKKACDTYIPLLLAFLIRHMRTSLHFIPQNSAHCDWCSFKNLCMLPPKSEEVLRDSHAADD